MFPNWSEQTLSPIQADCPSKLKLSSALLPSTPVSLKLRAFARRICHFWSPPTIDDSPLLLMNVWVGAVADTIREDVAVASQDVSMTGT